MFGMMIMVMFPQSLRAQGGIVREPPQPERTDLWIADGDNIYNGNAANVGVGTPTPAYQLDIMSTINVIARFGTSASAHSQVLITAPTGYNSNLTFQQGDVDKWYLGNRAANNRFSFIESTGVTEVFSILQNGSVGVGTVAPGFRFDVQGGQINSSGGLCIAGDCKTAWSQVGGGASQWTTSGAHIFYNTGNVGVGTSGPSSALHLVSTDSTNGQFRSTYDANNYIKFSTPSNGLSTIYAGSSALFSENTALTLKIDNTGPLGGYYLFGIKDAGNNYKFQVSSDGSAIFAGNPMAPLYKSQTGSMTAYYGVVGNDSSNMGGIFAGGTASSNQVFGSNWSGNNVFLSGNGAAGDLAFKTNGATRMYLSPSGNVGVGTGAPAYRLDVQGGQLNSSGGLCIAGDCKTAWSQVGGGASQWTTSGSNIFYNTGNVGVGTTTPSSALEVAGITKSQAFNLNGMSAEKAFSTTWGNGIANQKVQVYWPAATQVDGIYEITVTGHYWYSNSNGGIRKRIVINGRNIGIINMEESEVPFRMGYTGNSNTISNIMWDATNNRYYFIVSNLDNAQNGITIHVKSITPGPTPANADNLNLSPIYTTDTTVYPQLFTSFMSSNVGVGTNTPGYKLDVQGGQLNASGGLCIAGDCKSSWSQVAGSSQWTNSGSNIYFNTGNVGVGVASPTYKLHVGGTVNATGLFVNDSPVTSSQWATSGTTINYATGNVGIGTASPSAKLDVNGTINATGFTLSGAAIVSSQWTTNGANIGRGSGSVGIGTTAPTFKLDVQGGNVNASGGLCIAGDCKTAWSQLGGSQWTTSGANVFYNTGNVGVGTNSPSAGLDVQSPISANPTANGARLQQTLTAGPNNSELNGLYINPNFQDGQAVGVRHNALVTTAGNVGIGTSATAAGLDVQNTGSTTSGATYGARFQQVLPSAGNNATSTAVYINPTFSDGQAIGVRHNGLVVASGDVGIGTMTPAVKLDVAGALHVSGVCGTSVPNVQGAYLSWNQLSCGGGELDFINHQGGGSGGFWFANSANGSSLNSLMFIAGNGNVGVGTNSPQKKLDVVGDLNASGTVTAGNIIAKYQDLAEWVESSQLLSAGTVVVLDRKKSNQVIASSQAYDTRVAGVISLQPGITLGEKSESKVLVATTGRVKVKVDATAGPIEVGDLLVTSDREGVAKKSEPLNLGGVQIHRPGTLIGKALEPLAKGTGEILVLLSLQ